MKLTYQVFDLVSKGRDTLGSFSVAWQCVPSVDNSETVETPSHFISSYRAYKIQCITCGPCCPGWVVSDQGEPGIKVNFVNDVYDLKHLN